MEAWQPAAPDGGCVYLLAVWYWLYERAAG